MSLGTILLIILVIALLGGLAESVVAASMAAVLISAVGLAS